MRPRDWPESMPAIPRQLQGTFYPPKDDDGRSSSTVDPRYPMPCKFEATPYENPELPLAALQHALRRHRLLFLWYFHPRHDHVPEQMEPDKCGLYETLDLIQYPPPACRSWESIFDYETEINDWLRAQQRALGESPRGKPLRDIRADYPTPSFVTWHLEDAQQTPLDDSSKVISRFVGAALREPKRQYIGEEDAKALRACADVAMVPIWNAAASPLRWADHPVVSWNYPEKLQLQAEKLDSLVLMEAGAASIPPRMLQKPSESPIIVLKGLGEDPVVLGQTVPRLTNQRYKIVEALLKADDQGLSRDELLRLSGGALKTLNSLRLSHDAWKQVIQMAGHAGRRYRIKRPSASS